MLSLGVPLLSLLGLAVAVLPLLVMAVVDRGPRQSKLGFAGVRIVYA